MLDAGPLPFDLRALEIFVATCASGSMSAAAKQLGISQPAVSQAVADLEARAGLALLDRASRPISPTAAGLVLFERARALLDDARQIAPLLRQTRDGKVAMLRIGLVDSLSRAVSSALADAARDLADQAVFRAGLTDDHASALLTRRLDVFLGADDQADLAQVERLPLLREPYVLITPRTAGLPAQPTLPLLAGSLGFIRYTSRSRTGAEIERHLRRLRIEPAQGLAFDGPFGVTEAVARGLGFAITTPLCLYESNADWQAVQVHALPAPGLARDLFLIARAREFGRIPQRLANVARAAISAQVLPALRAQSPWLAASLKLLPG